jgi:hypothetical protein
MSVRREIAERLFITANKTAVDILFPYIREINYQPKNTPSGKEIISRWKSLPANTAINIAVAIKDPEILDALAEKEKRKTVRCAIARNKNLHPVTRFYYFQESLVNSDHDLRNAVLSSIGPEELLFYMQDEDVAINYRKISSILSDIIDKKDYKVVANYKANLSDEKFDAIANGLLSKNADVALEIFDFCKISIENLKISPNPNRITSNDINTWRKLYSIDKEGVTDSLLYHYRDDAKKLAEIDEKLISSLLGNHSYDLDAVMILAEHNLLNKLMDQNPKLSEDAIKFIIDQPVDLRNKSKAIILCEDYEYSLGKIENFELFSESLSLHEKPQRVFSWIHNAAKLLGKDRCLTLINTLTKNDNKGNIELTFRSISNLAAYLDIKNSDFIIMLSDNSINKITSFPQLEDVDNVIMRIKENGNDAIYKKLAISILENNYNNESKFIDEILEIAINSRDFDTIFTWLSKITIEEAKKYVSQYKDIFAKEIVNSRESDRAIWLSEVVDIIKPASGWGAIRGSSITAAAMDYLDSNMSQENAHWESALCLYESWTGTLPELIKVSKQL